MVAHLSQSPERREVLVNGKPFNWTAERGLDPNAVVELKGFIHTLVGAHLRSARQNGICFDDLSQDASKAAIEAAARFNPDGGAAFITYASYFIKGAIFDGLKDRLIRTPGVRRPYSFVPVDQPSPGCDQATPLEWLLPTSEWKKLAHAMENSIMQEEELIRLRQHLQELPTKHRCVIELLFGFTTGIPMTPSAVAKRANISRAEVAQISRTALGTLRASISTPRCLPAAKQNASKKAGRNGWAA